VTGSGAPFIAAGLISGVGAAATLGLGAPPALWVGLAALSVTFSTLAMVRLPRLARRATATPPFLSPYFVDRVRDAVRGDRLAREYVLERIDTWGLAPRGSPPGRLAADPRFYRASPEAFRNFLEVVVRTQEGPR
jgi:hypothetical protein